MPTARLNVASNMSQGMFLPPSVREIGRCHRFCSTCELYLMVFYSATFCFLPAFDFSPRTPHYFGSFAAPAANPRSFLDLHASCPHSQKCSVHASCCQTLLLSANSHAHHPHTSRVFSCLCHTLSRYHLLLPNLHSSYQTTIIQFCLAAAAFDMIFRACRVTNSSASTVRVEANIDEPHVPADMDNYRQHPAFNHHHAHAELEREEASAAMCSSTVTLSNVFLTNKAKRLDVIANCSRIGSQFEQSMTQHHQHISQPATRFSWHEKHHPRRIRPCSIQRTLPVLW